MLQVEQNAEKLMDDMMRELWRLRSYYRRLMLSGTVLGLVLILAGFRLIHPWWGRIVTIWLGVSIICGVVWIYLNAYQRMIQEINFYKSLYGVRRRGSSFALGPLVPAAPFVTAIRRVAVPRYIFYFFVGFLLALLVAVKMQDEYETGFFDSLADKVQAGRQDKTRDSVLVRAMHLTHTLLASRAAIYSSSAQSGFISRYIHPLSSDLVTADGACGSYASVLCQLLLTLDFKPRLLQMKATDGKVCHIVLEVWSSTGWVVLDPLYDLYFTKKDGGFASFEDVSGDWNWYSRQTPANYNPAYSYSSARYTNWAKIPIIMPLARLIIGAQMNKEDLEHLSVRTYFLRKYRIIQYMIVLLLVLMLTPPVIRFLKRAVNVKGILMGRLLVNFYHR